MASCMELCLLLGSMNHEARASSVSSSQKVAAACAVGDASCVVQPSSPG